MENRVGRNPFQKTAKKSAQIKARPSGLKASKRPNISKATLPKAKTVVQKRQHILKASPKLAPILEGTPANRESVRESSQPPRESLDAASVSPKPNEAIGRAVFHLCLEGCRTGIKAFLITRELAREGLQWLRRSSVSKSNPV